MSDDLDQTDGARGKHAAARQLAEQALRAQAAGDEEEAERLFADAERADPQAVIAGSNMAYRQANAATRRTIIEYLKDQ